MIYVDNDSINSQLIYIPRDDEFEGATGHTLTLQRKDYVINENGVTHIHPDYPEYDGISGGTISVYVSAATGVTFEDLEVTENGRYVPSGDSVYTGVTVNVPGYDEGYHDGFEAGYSSGVTDGYSSGHTDGYNEGYSSGVTDGYNSGSTEGFDAGYASGFTEGYASGQTDGYSSGYTAGFEAGYSSGRTDGYASGYTDGMEAQKALLGELSATTNGTYTSETGYSAVTVNVATGSSATLSSETFTLNGQYTPPQGVDGWSAVTVNVDTASTYNSGYTEGYSAGTEDTKAQFTAITATTNGVYTSDTGYSGVTVNVTGATPAVLTGLTATTTGVYTPPQGVDGFNEVDVNIPFGSISIGISTEGSYEFRASDYGYEGISTFQVDVNTDVAFNSGYTSGVTEYRVHACTATLKITADTTTERIYWPNPIYGKPVNVVNVHINELNEDLSTASTYTFASAGTYTLEFYTNGAPRVAIQSDYLTDVNITCDAIDQFFLGTLENPNLSAITFDNSTNVIYIPTNFCEDGGNPSSSLTAITIPDTVREIGSRAFQACNLRSVVLGENVDSIGFKAFFANRDLDTITCKNFFAPHLATHVFDQIASTGTLNIPTGSDYSLMIAELPSGWTVNYVS